MLEILSDRPGIAKLERFLENCLSQKEDEIELIVLFGSMARGDWSMDSDYDVLIGLSIEDGQRFIDRLGEYASFSEGRVEPVAYSKSEIQQMFKSFHLTLLESLDYGIALYDKGAWRIMKSEFEEWLDVGVVKREDKLWKYFPELVEGTRNRA